jgi:hypothetical protein
MICPAGVNSDRSFCTLPFTAANPISGSCTAANGTNVGRALAFGNNSTSLGVVGT